MYCIIKVPKVAEKKGEKCSVENKVGYLRRNLLVPMPEFSSLEEFNQKLLKHCDSDHERRHYLKGKLISELLVEDQEAFRALPRVAFDTASYISVRTNKYGQFKLHKGKHIYSASPTFCEEEICVREATLPAKYINLPDDATADTELSR